MYDDHRKYPFKGNTPELAGNPLTSYYLRFLNERYRIHLNRINKKQIL